MPDWVAVAVGAFADPSFPHPTYSSYGERLTIASVGDSGPGSIEKE